MQGRRVERLGRRGKYLVWELEDEAFLLMHLRMTGTLLYDPPPGTPYARVRWELDDGHELRFCDPRRFGTGELALGPAARDAFFAERLGLEPLDGELTGEALRRMARGRRAPVKAFLLDQRRIAGVGNIYADEALFRARVHPLRPAGRLTRAQWDAVAQGVREALTAGLAAGGATIDDFRHADGVRGSFQDEFLVHRRVRRALPTMRHGGGEVRRRRARDLRVRALPAAAAAPASGRRGELGEPAGLVGLHELGEAAHDLVPDDDLGEAHHPRALDELRASDRVLCEIDLLKQEAAAVEQRLGAGAE